MRSALFHCIVRDTFGDVRVMAVTTSKARRLCGRDVRTGEPTNVRASDIYATLTGPDGAAKAQALIESIKQLRAARNAKRKEACAALRIAEDKADAEFKAAVDAEIAKVQP